MAATIIAATMMATVLTTVKTGAGAVRVLMAPPCGHRRLGKIGTF
jgi:hypothetical protein